MKHFLSTTHTTPDLIFTFALSVLLLSFPWDNNVSSWAVVLFSLLVLFTRADAFKRLSANKIYLFLVLFFFYINFPFLFTDPESADYSFIIDNLPYLLFPFIFASRFRNASQGRKNTFLLIFAFGSTLGFLGCFFYAMYTFWDEFYLFLNGYEPVTKLIGIHPAYLSLYVSFSFVIVLEIFMGGYRNSSRHEKIYYTIWLFILVLGVFYIRSRTGVASFILVVVISILYRAPRSRRMIMIGSFAAFLVLLYFIVDITSFHKGRFQIEQVLTGVDKKKLQWQASINVIKTNPAFGVTVIRAQEELNKQYRLLDFDEGINFRYNSHNQFLTTLVQGGIMGAIFLFLPFCILFYRGLKSRDLIIIGFFLLTSLAFMTETMLHRHKGIIFYVTFLVLLGARKEKDPDDRPSPIASKGR